MTIEIGRYPSDHPTKAKLFAKVDMTKRQVDTEQLCAAFAKQGVPFQPGMPFPQNLMPGAKLEWQTDSRNDGLMVVRYYGPLNEVKQPASKPFDEDDEL